MSNVVLISKKSSWPFMFFFLSLTPLHSKAKNLTATLVAESIREHFPQFLQQTQKLRESEGKLREKRAPFDWQIEGKYKERTEGFYDGEVREAGLRKELQSFGAEFLAGQRESNGAFPEYEGEDVTGLGGETFVGLNLNILKDSWIDSRRFELRRARLGFDIQQIMTFWKQNEILQKGLKVYWEWLGNEAIVDVYRDLLGIAQDRQRGLEIKFEKGDIAKIYLTENQQYLIKRRNQLVKAQRAAKESAQQLQLYVRDQQGRPIEIDGNWSPADFPELPKWKDSSWQSMTNSLTANFPPVKLVELELGIAQKQYSLGLNQRLPKLQLGLQQSFHQGQLPKGIDEEEQKIALTLKFPLEQSKGRGLQTQALAVQTSLKLEKRFLEEKLQTDLSQFRIRFDTFHQNYELAKQEVELAKILADAERAKFRAGEGNFLLVNLREQSVADAEVKFIKGKVNWLKTYSLFLQMTGLPEQLGLY